MSEKERMQLLRDIGFTNISFDNNDNNNNDSKDTQITKSRNKSRALSS